MRKYKINRASEPKKLPSKEAIQKYKDFGRLTHEYDRVVKRPKKPLYKDRRMFFIILLVALLAYLLSEAAKEEEQSEKENEDSGFRIEQLDDRTIT